MYVWGHCDGDVTHGEQFEKFLEQRELMHIDSSIYKICVSVCCQCVHFREEIQCEYLHVRDFQQFLHLFISPAHREFRHSLKNEIKNLLIFGEALLFQSKLTEVGSEYLSNIFAWPSVVLVIPK